MKIHPLKEDDSGKYLKQRIWPFLQEKPQFWQLEMSILVFVHAAIWGKSETIQL